MSDYLQDRLVAAVGDHYLIEGEIGRGGMAAVYRALDVRLNRHVAIKVLPPDLAFNADVKARFLREAQTAAQLNHPNIVPIYAVDEQDGVVFFVMALVEGDSLARILHQAPHASADQVRTVVGQVADALDYAHRKGVVHRDIKPDNILVDRATGRVMVTDFGIARAAAADSRLTVTGVAVGTPAYMSPEQALGERDVDGRSDIYSLGVVAYQMLTGEQPFKATNTPAMLVKHVSETPRPIRTLRPDAPPALVRAVEVAMAKKPEERWPTAAAFAEALRAPAPVAAPPATPSAEQLQETGFAPAQPPAPPAGPRVSIGIHTGGLQLPPLPIGGTRDEWQDWKQEVRDAARSHRDLVRWGESERREARRASRRDRRDFNLRPVEQRITIFRRELIGTSSTLLMLFLINMATSPHFWWWVFPAVGMGIGLLSRGASLWSDGVSLGQIFSRRKPRVDVMVVDTRSPTASAPEAAALPEPPLVADDVLAGPHGAAVRRASGDRIVIREVLAKLTPEERQLLPDIAPTVQALAERVGSLATTLHRLDADVSGANLGALDQRIAELKRETPTADRDRRITLLERQRSTLHDLLARRSTLLSQFESACLAMQNLKLDLLKLRSAGISAALGDVTSATQQARAVSREIGHAIEAADEVRRL
ncbi:MAG TPA: protein kinase [Gemmatimonadaceae bacterium]|nr:protein kinase [Gemmatimonadaceae bacterium]